MTLPNFYIVGAGRSGSTSLYAYCRRHPAIFMSPVKEPNYFAFRDERPPFGGPAVAIARRTAIRTADAYRGLFANAAGRPVVGEASVNYLRFPRVCRAIRQEAPDARLVMLLRQPVERAYSSYMNKRRDGLEPCAEFEEAWGDHDRRAAENWWHCMHKGKSLYLDQVRTYLEVFPRQQIRILLTEELQTDPLATLRQLFRFLGVDTGPAAHCHQHHNQGGEIDNWLLRHLWRRTPALRALLVPVLPLALRGRLFPFLASRRRKAHNRPLPAETRARLTDELRDDILGLQDSIGRDLGCWLRPDPRG